MSIIKQPVSFLRLFTLFMADKNWKIRFEMRKMYGWHDDDEPNMDVRREHVYETNIPKTMNS